MLNILFIIILVAAILIAAKRLMAGKQNAAQNHQLGQAFLQENGQKEGVVTTESGLQYLVLHPGTGSQHPIATDTVTVHYHGSLIDGTVFDSSVERNETISFPLNRVIKGWTEGVQLMVTGEKTRFFIPSELAYGDSGAGKIPPGSLLIFEVELFEIKP